MRRNFHRFVIGVTAAALVGLAASSPAGADSTGEIKYRQGVMKAVAGHMGAIAGIVKGEVDYTAHLSAHADAVADIGKSVGDLFPDGSDQGDTKALPAIWEKPDQFGKAVDAFQTASMNLAEAAGSGDLNAVGAALGAIGKTCGGCHDAFRQKK